MRNSVDVCHVIIKVVPKKHHSLFEELIASFSYKSPEMVNYCWCILTEKYNELLDGETPLKTKWKRDMIELLINKSLPLL